MKGFIALICVAAFAVLAHGFTEDEKQRINTVHDECQSNPATHIEEELMIKLHKGEKIDKSIVGPHVLCMSKNLGFQKANGDIDNAELRVKFARVIKDEAKLNKAVEECGVQGSSDQDTALAMLKCFHKHTGNTLHVHQH